MEPTTVTCNGSCTVTHVITVDLGGSGLSSQQVTDLVELWGLILVAAVIVLGAKALYKRFRIDYDH
jgi:hypothetical protein